MKLRQYLAWLALIGAGLAGCDNLDNPVTTAMKEIKPGVSTGYDVRQKYGTPTLEWREDDGSVVWEFARTPEGKRNYQATIGPDHVVRDFRNVLTEENFAKVQKGMSRDQVRRLLGKPGRIAQLGLKNQEVWDWKYENPHNADLRFNVHFNQQGVVEETSRNEEFKG